MEKRQKTIDIFIASDGSEHLTEFLCEQHEVKLGEQKVMSAMQLMNEAARQENEARVEAVRRRWQEHPEEKEAFLEKIRAEHLANLQMGVEFGWWPGFTDRGPLAPPKVFKLSDLEPHEHTRAHIAHMVGAFKSVSDARKNGQNIPLVAGDEFWLKKKTIHIKVEA